MDVEVDTLIDNILEKGEEPCRLVVSWVSVVIPTGWDLPCHTGRFSSKEIMDIIQFTRRSIQLIIELTSRYFQVYRSNQ